jgi:hypothetical protein
MAAAPPDGGPLGTTGCAAAAVRAADASSAATRGFGGDFSGAAAGFGSVISGALEAGGFIRAGRLASASGAVVWTGRPIIVMPPAVGPGAPPSEMVMTVRMSRSDVRPVIDGMTRRAAISTP